MIYDPVKFSFHPNSIARMERGNKRIGITQEILNAMFTDTPDEMIESAYCDLNYKFYGEHDVERAIKKLNVAHKIKQGEYLGKPLSEIPRDTLGDPEFTCDFYIDDSYKHIGIFEEDYPADTVEAHIVMFPYENDVLFTDYANSDQGTEMRKIEDRKRSMVMDHYYPCPDNLESDFYEEANQYMDALMHRRVIDEQAADDLFPQEEGHEYSSHSRLNVRIEEYISLRMGQRNCNCKDS